MAENQIKIGKQPTFDQYPKFEWTPGISIMEEMIESEEEELNEENAEVELI